MTSLCCMIVEDQALIGMSLEDLLEDAGFSVAGPFPSCAAALHWLEHNTPRFAVLDMTLLDGDALPVARKLKGSNTPFAIYSGLPHIAHLPEELKGVPWVEKPAAREELTRAIEVLQRAAP